MTRVGGNTASLRGLSLRRAPEAELVDSAVRGDPAAFAEVYRRFHTPVYAFCLSRLLQPAAAEDAAQEVFVRLLSAESGSIKRPLPWLFGVARHVCIDTSRRLSREITTELGAHDLIDSFDTEERVTAREDVARIAITLKGLNPRYRTALVMHEMHAQSATEVAKAFGIGLGATYTLLSRARDAFNSAYARAEAMSEPCTQAIDILYRRSREGASQDEEVRLQQHLAECESCSREARRFARSERLAALRGAFALPVLSRWWTQSQHWLDPLISRVAPEAAHAAAASVAAVATALVLTTAVTSASEPQAAGHDDRSRVVASATAAAVVKPATGSTEQSQSREYNRQRAAIAAAGQQPRRTGTRPSSGESLAGPHSDGAAGAGAGDSSGSRAPEEQQREPAAAGQPTARMTQKSPAETAVKPAGSGAAAPTGGSSGTPTGGARGTSD